MSKGRSTIRFYWVLWQANAIFITSPMASKVSYSKHTISNCFQMPWPSKKTRLRGFSFWNIFFWERLRPKWNWNPRFLPEAGDVRRNLGTATFLASPTEICNEPPLPPAKQHSLNNAAAPPDNIQSDRFGDEVCDRGELFIALNDCKKQAWNAERERPLFCTRRRKSCNWEDKVSKGKFSWAPSKETKPQDVDQRASASATWKKKQKVETLFSSQNVKKL